MSRYTTLLLDADGTLLDFNAAERQALINLYSKNNIEVTEENLAAYSRINLMMWKLLEKGEISKQQLISERFSILFKELGLNRNDGEELSLKYGLELQKQCQLISGALGTVIELSKQYELVIITNGNASTQHDRLRDSGLIPYMKHVFISDEMGVQKPRKEFFEEVMKVIDEKNPARLLVVGDSLSSDIQGANNAGLDSCWINPEHVQAPKENSPTYIIENINEIFSVLK